MNTIAESTITLSAGGFGGLMFMAGTFFGIIVSKMIRVIATGSLDA